MWHSSYIIDDRLSHWKHLLRHLLQWSKCIPLFSISGVKPLEIKHENPTTPWMTYQLAIRNINPFLNPEKSSNYIWTSSFPNSNLGGACCATICPWLHQRLTPRPSAPWQKARKIVGAGGGLRARWVFDGFYSSNCPEISKKWLWVLKSSMVWLCFESHPKRMELISKEWICWFWSNWQTYLFIYLGNSGKIILNGGKSYVLGTHMSYQESVTCTGNFN